MAISKFRRGESTFNCRVCGRLTRHTGTQSVGSELCPQDFELAGLENMVLDGTPFEEIRLEAAGLVAEIIAKGGKPKVEFFSQWTGRVSVTNERPPVPSTAFDWQATFEGYDQRDPIGHGKDRAAAIAELFASAAAADPKLAELAG